MEVPQRSYLFPGDLGSDTFRVQVDSHPTAVSAIPSLPTSEYASIAADFRKFKQACWIDPPKYMGVHYAQVEADGPILVSITCPAPAHSCIVHPLRREVKAEIHGPRVTLILPTTEPRYAIVEIDEYPPLLLIFESIETNAPDRNSPKTLDIGGFVSDSETVAERTEGFHRAFAEAAKTGKTLYVPAGVYHVNALKIHNLDGLHVYFAPGSLIRTEISPTGENIHSHGLWLQDSKNIHISGRGCLDHQGFGNFVHGRNAYDHGLISYFVTNTLCPFVTESPVFMLRCANVTMEGFMVRNGRNMNFNIRRCDDVTLRRCKIVTPPASSPEYTDGFHTNSCRNVHIEDCLAFCNDDCFASGHYTHFDDRDSGHHFIRGMVGWNVRANGIRLGFHTYYNLGDFTFENCDFAGITGRGLMVHPLHDAEEAGRFQRYGGLSLLNCGFDCRRATEALIEVDGARIPRLDIRDCTFDRKGLMQIRGHDDAGRVDQLVIRNLRLDGHRVGSAAEVGLETQFVGEIQVQ